MSNTLSLNNHLVITCPDGFHVMDAAERGKLTFIGDGPGEAIADPDRHIVITIGWKPIGGFINILLSAKDIAKDMEKRISKPMRAYGYRANGSLTKAVGGERAEGFGYEYEAQGVGMYGESCVLKREKTLYYLHFYARTALKAESLEAWDAMLASARWE